MSALELSDVGWGWALPSIVLAAGSVALAAWATVPVLDEVRPGDLDDVDRFFSKQLKVRGGLVRAAAIGLGLALLLTPLPALAAALKKDSADVTLTAARQGRSYSINTSARDLGDGARLTVVAEGGPVKILILRIEAGDRSSLDAHASVPLSTLRGTAELRATAHRGGKVLAQRSLSLMP